MKKIKIFSLSILVLLLAFAPVKLMSLGNKLESLLLKPYIYSPSKTEVKGIEIGFYGTTCLTFTYKGRTFLNDPFFSNPGFFEILTGKYTDRKNIITPIVEKIDSISMVSITHGHYDHCMDFEAFAPKYIADAKFISSGSTLRSIAPWMKGHKNWKQYHVEKIAKFNWIYSEDKIFRIHPILSQHLPHVGNKVLFSGVNPTPLDKTPGPVWQWLEGGSYSYMIDVLDENEIVSRFLIVSGKLPDEALEIINDLQKERRIDIMFSPYFDKELSNEPFITSYQVLKPKEVIFHHWNNFFKNPEKPLQKLKSSDIENEVKSKKEEGYPVSVMMPFSQISI